jgi:hypothetical protein
VSADARALIDRGRALASGVAPAAKNCPGCGRESGPPCNGCFFFAADGVPAFDATQKCQLEALADSRAPLVGTQCPRCKNPHHACDFAHGVSELPGRLPFDQWPQSARGAYEALEKHLEKGPSFPLALLMQIRVQLSDGVREVQGG